MAQKLKFIDPNKIREMIAMQGLQENAFAKQHKLNPALFNQYLNGRRQPIARTAKRISKALGKDISEIFTV
ncbi:XRE family transcriptional regulator [Oenococcus sp.]|uniref:XRE family transcriptional regulator n=1 Tax=Oenococcus sp. TaxID=1979414 RepID=UPI0039E81B6D